MKNKKTISILFVLAICLSLHQSAVAQKTQGLRPKNVLGNISDVLSGGNQLQAQKTRELMSNTLLSNSSEILGDDNQLFLINLGRPTMGIMKDSSNPGKMDFWYVVVTNEAIDDEIRYNHR